MILLFGFLIIEAVDMISLPHSACAKLTLSSFSPHACLRECADLSAGARGSQLFPSWQLSVRKPCWQMVSKTFQSVSFCLFTWLLPQFRSPSPPTQNTITNFTLSSDAILPFVSPLYLLYLSNMFFLRNLFNCIACLFKLFRTSHCLQGIKSMWHADPLCSGFCSRLLVTDSNSVPQLFALFVVPECAMWSLALSLCRVLLLKIHSLLPLLDLTLPYSDLGLTVSSGSSLLTLQAVIGTFLRSPVGGTKRLHSYWSNVFSIDFLSFSKYPLYFLQIITA